MGGEREPDDLADGDDDELLAPAAEEAAGGFLEQHAALEDLRALLEAHRRRGFVCWLEEGRGTTQKLHEADGAGAEEIALVAEHFGFLDLAEVARLAGFARLAGLAGVANLTARG